MITDESSSDSETGRFKCRSKTQSEQTHSTKREVHSRSDPRNRNSDDKFHRDIDRRRSDRDQYGRRSRDRLRYSRHSPPRRRPSRERSPARKPHEHERSRHGRDYSERTKLRDRSASPERRRHSRSKSHKSPDLRRGIKDDTRHPRSRDDTRSKEISREKVYDKFQRTSRHTSPAFRSEKSVVKIDKIVEKSVSPEYKGKKSEVYKAPAEIPKKKSESPIIVEEHSDTNEVLPGSYYSMIPTVTKEKSEESSEIDSSDDERLRAKLLNLEKELHKTKKKKSKKKHKKKCSKSKEDRESSNVEVSSTTDIDKPVTDVPTENTEVTSTQKSCQKEMSEEGEVSSDDSQEQVDIDPTDLRHKLRNTKRDICGPALPPHLESKIKKSSSKDIEGPALPPHLSRPKNIGPSIPEDMRKVLAETDHTAIKYESSDEDTGIGPLPVGDEQKWSEAHQRLEERALDIKIRRLDGHTVQKSDAKSREQWMLELPEGKAKILGLEARSFRARAGPDMSDRSSWTDTPEQKARKAAGEERAEDPEVVLQREARARHIASRDEDQEKAARKHKKKHKRDESLLEQHQKKLKKKKKKEDKDEDKKERRPFSRDVDLQVNKFDEAQKKSIIKKAQELNTRFSRGEAKYL